MMEVSTEAVKLESKLVREGGTVEVTLHCVCVCVCVCVTSNE